MKSVKIFFTVLTLAAMPLVGIAAPKAATHPAATTHSLFKADLSAAAIPGVKTGAVGEAVFMPTLSTKPGIAGAGAGGTDRYPQDMNGMSSMGTSVPGDNTGMSGPGQGFDQGGLGTMYAGFVNPDLNNTGSAAIGTARGYWGMVDDRPSFLSDASPDTSRHASIGITGYAAGGTTKGAAVPIVPDSLAYMVSANNISDVSGAYLQMGKPGSGGPAVATLYAGPKKEGPFNGLLAEGTITSADLTGPMAGKSVSDLVNAIKKGDVYVNILSATHPSGEMSGIVRPVS